MRPKITSKKLFRYRDPIECKMRRREKHDAAVARSRSKEREARQAVEAYR